ncbi:hypothetical protein IEQ34_017459 [Dendrobium chrysotoxum]|uniref:Uncharacterized protein n=1 Tax=Dendrobium chrysotoxum TaxID=161865 RepID=A0AAV7FTV2_DENCH|nr:hypothetical protein IEQ34_017459 [Dendrobium chrysotoxum]
MTGFESDNTTKPLIFDAKLLSTTQFLGFYYGLANTSNKIWVLCKDPVVIDVIADFTQCFTSFFYASSSRFARRSLWEQLPTFHFVVSLSCLIGGDFNTIYSPSEGISAANPIY